MIASHAAHPTGVARIMNEHPRARQEIMALIHQTLGNGFAQEVIEASSRLMRADADGKPGEDPRSPAKATTDAAAEEVRKKDDAPTLYEAADGRILKRGNGPATSPEELRANADAKGPQSAPNTDPAKASAAGDEINAYEAELGVGSSAKAPPSASPAPAETKPAGLSKAQTEANMMQVDDMDATPLVVGKQDEAKVAKDETVIGASSEVKAPEIVKQTEVLKDPDQKADEPQKAADVAKDDDGENEAVGGTKPDIGPVKVTASVLRVRSTPTIGRDNILGRLMRNQVVEAVGHQGDWVEINYRGQTAFIHSSFVVGALEAPAAKTAEPPTAATAT